jgi:N-acylneuraminate cytidylyltransferase
MTSIKACIFARGGSKGLPGKNIRLFAGKPLIAWAIEAAKGVDGIDEVLVSTDSEEIAKVALDFGAHVPFLRPEDLSRDDSPEWNAWRHALQYFHDNDGEMPGALLSVPTTAPLRVVEDLQKCVDLYQAGGCDSVITVTEAHRNPYFNMVSLAENGDTEIVCQNAGGLTRRQDAPEVFDITTVAYVVNSDFIMKRNGLFEGVVKSTRVPIERSIDIDTIFDFEVAEFLMRRRLETL